MTLAIDTYLRRRFHIRDQNCWHMARDAWFDLTGTDIGDRTPERITEATLIGRFASDVPSDFEELPAPIDPCLVLIRRAGDVPHVGVFTRGRILQIDAAGPTFLPLDRAVTVAAEVGYYRPCPASCLPKTRSDPTPGKSSKAT